MAPPGVRRGEGLPVRRAAVLVLLVSLSVPFAVPAAVTQDPGGHYDDLGVWVPDQPPAATSLPGADLGAYRNHSEMAAYLQQLEAAHPGLVERTSIGQSVRGLDLWAVTLTDEATPGPKPRVLIDAAHHGDEVIGTEIALRLARDLTAGFAANATIRALLQGREVLVVPMANPDGVTLIPQATHYATARKNANGVDTNRNYDYHWGGPGSGGPGSDTYRGPSAFSEPETRAIRDLLHDKPALMYISIHSGAELILWPWGWTTANHIERGAYDQLGDRLTDLTHKKVPNGQTSQILYVASGVSMDYGAGALDMLRPMSFSPETFRGSGDAFNWWPLFNPPDNQIESVYQNWKEALLHVIDVAPRYTDARLASADRGVTGESFVQAADLTAPGLRGFLNATMELRAPPQVELFSAPLVSVGDVGSGGSARGSWILQANENGTFLVEVRAMSGEAAGNLSRSVVVHAHDVVKYVALAKPLMGAQEWNVGQVWLGGFGLTNVTGRLRVVSEGAGGGEVFFNETVTIPDGGSAERDVAIGSGDRPPGRTVLVLTYDLTGEGPDGPVARHVEQRASYTIVRPDLSITKTLPATSAVSRQFAVRTVLRNVGQEPTQNLTFEEVVPAGYAFVSQGAPSQANPLQPFSRPAPSLVLPGADGALRLVYENVTLAPGGSVTIDYRLTALRPGTHEFRTEAEYTQGQRPGRPYPIILKDEAAVTQTVA